MEIVAQNRLADTNQVSVDFFRRLWYKAIVGPREEGQWEWGTGSTRERR